jgi:tyrosyl-tRNA synthetase
MLSIEETDANAAAIRKQLSRFLAFEGPAAARMLDNATWLRPLLLMEFLRDTGKHFTVNYMLQKESVMARMETGISFTEFAYMLVQAYDFHHLFTTERCELQMGGSDQWGNITAGIELIARREGGKAHGLVCPLLTTASGGKFGKSEGENIWLDPERTSPYRFYQFWLNTDDRDVERFLGIFTFFPLEEIRGLLQRHAANPGQRIPHRALAEELTTRVHGEAVSRRAVAASAILFGGGDIRDADGETLALVAGEVTVSPVTKRQLEDGLPMVEALTGSGLASSKADARRGLEAGGFSVNGERAALDRQLGPNDVLAGRFILLQKGKKTYAMIEIR